MSEVFTYASPESVGLSSVDIKRFVEVLEENALYMHSIMVIRHGKIVAEGYWKPFNKDFRHRMYSVSKSFVAGAIGLLLDKGKIKLSDRICTYFPEYPEENMHPYIRETTIRNLLMMATPFENSYALKGNGRNVKYWVESFFTEKPNKPSGTVFCYDTSATFILNVLVERLTGKPFMDYLYDEILHKLDFSKNVKCIKSPDGFSWGGSGVLCTTLDLAKYAYIYLKCGKINGEQLLSESFVKQATSMQIETDTFAYGGNIYSAMGYGYQIWRGEDNSFVFNGMGNQHAFCYPDKDLMIVCTADNQGGKAFDTARMLRLAIKHLIVDKCEEKVLPENPKALSALHEKLDSLSLIMPKGAKSSPAAENIHGKTYKLLENSLGFEWVRFDFGETAGTMYYKNSRGEKSLTFGYGEYMEGNLPETHYSGDCIGVPSGRGYRYVGAGVWPEENHLLLRFNIIDEYIGNLTFAFGFCDNKIGFRASKAAEAFLDDYEGLAGGEA